MSKNNISVLVTATSLALCGASHAADSLTLNIGTDYSSGKFGSTDRQTVWSVPLSVKYVTGPLALRVSTSWISISGTGVIYPSGLGGIGDDTGRGRGGDGGSGSHSGKSGGGGGGGVPGPFATPCDTRSGARKPEDNVACATGVVPAGATATVPVRSTESGFGDVVAAGIYTAIDSKGLTLDVIGKVKFATASNTKGLGTGKNDYAVQMEAEQAIGKGFIFGGAGYKWLGDPDFINLRNVAYVSVGGGYKPTSDTTVGLSYDYSQSARSGGPAPQEVSLYAAHWVTKNIKLNSFVFKGLSDGSPDWGAGLNLGYRF